MSEKPPEKKKKSRASKDEEKRPAKADFTRLRHCVAKVFDRAWACAKRMEVIEGIVRERIEAEANFARSIDKIQELNFPEEGTLFDPLIAVSSDLKNQFKIRAEFANNLNTDVLAPLAEFRPDFIRSMRAAHQRWRKAQKMWQNVDNKFQRQ